MKRWSSRRARWAFVPLLCGFAAGLATIAFAAVGSEVVARLGGTDITAAMLGNYLRTLDPALRQQAFADGAVMDRLVRLEIARMAVLKEAKAKKWDQRPEVAQEIERARSNAIVNTYLASLSAPPSDYPSAAEIQSAYDLNRDSFMQPRQYWLEQIFIASPANASAEAAAAAQKKAADVAAKAKAPDAKFEDLARTYSERKDTAERGGDLGWLPENDVVPEIRSQIAGMSKGEVSQPIHVADGWQIVRLVDIKPAAVRPLDEVKDTIIRALRQRKAAENQQAYVNELVRKNPISLNEIALRNLFAPSR
jgi:peptidylprolyl isomerase